MKLPIKDRQFCSLIYLLLHFAAHVSARLFEVMPGISIWYAPCGLALAILFLLGPRQAPLVFAANVVTAYTGEGLPEWWAPLFYPALLTANYTLFAWIGRRWLGAHFIPTTFAKAALFVLLMLTAPACTALVGNLVPLLSGFGDPAQFWPSVLRWWVGDFCGLITVVPAAVVFAGSWLREEPIPWASPREGPSVGLIIVLQATLLITLLTLTFVLEPLKAYHAFHLCFLPLIWICLDHGLPGATLGTLVTTLGGLIGIHYFGQSSHELIVNFLLFILAITGVGLGLGSVVSSRHMMQQRILRTQKMESLGVLAGGIAHDFNNLLTVILGNANLIRLDAEGNETVAASVSQIELASRKAADLCQQMLVYAGKAPLAVTSFELHGVIEKSIGMLGSAIPKDCRIIVQPPSAVARVLGDESQVRQVIITLLINAAEAMGDRAGRIIVRSDRRHLFKEDLRHHAADKQLEEGVYAILEIEDNGCGMSPEVLSRIYEPFFTTKFIGKGMGLAAVLGIVKANKGGISVISEKDVGTRFQLVFPAAEPPPSPAAPQPKRASFAVGGGVLVVDDDTAVRAVVVRCLGNLGFTTIQAGDGLEAVELFERHHESLCCVITDLAMPRMDGATALLQMRKIAPSVPVVLMSAYDPQRSLERLGGISPSGFIAKPFDLTSLEQHLRAILCESAR